MGTTRDKGQYRGRMTRKQTNKSRMTNKKRSRGRMTRKRTNRSRMTNKKRTSKILYKRSLRKNKYKSHKKCRAIMKGGRPTAWEDLVDRSRGLREMLKKEVDERHSLKQAKDTKLGKKKKSRSRLSRNGRRITQYFQRKNRNMTREKKVKTALGATLGLGTAAAVGLGFASGVIPAAAGTALITGAVGKAAAGTAAALTLGNKLRHADEFSFDYRFEYGDKEDIILKYTDKKNSNADFYIITGKNSGNIDILIKIMNDVFSTSNQQTSSEPVESVDSADSVDDNQKIDLINKISDRVTELEIDILDLESFSREASRLKQISKAEKYKRKLEQKYEEKITEIANQFDEALKEPYTKAFEMLKDLKEKIRAMNERVTGKNPVVLNQWVLGYTEPKKDGEEIQDEILIMFTEINTGDVIEVNVPRSQGVHVFKQAQLHYKTGKNLEQVCVEILRQANCNRNPLSIIEAFKALVTEIIEETETSSIGGIEEHFFQSQSNTTPPIESSDEAFSTATAAAATPAPAPGKIHFVSSPPEFIAWKRVGNRAVGEEDIILKVANMDIATLYGNEYTYPLLQINENRMVGFKTAIFNELAPFYKNLYFLENMDQLKLTYLNTNTNNFEDYPNKDQINAERFVNVKLEVNNPQYTPIKTRILGNPNPTGHNIKYAPLLPIQYSKTLLNEGATVDRPTIERINRILYEWYIHKYDVKMNVSPGETLFKYLHHESHEWKILTEDTSFSEMNSIDSGIIFLVQIAEESEPLV